MEVVHDDDDEKWMRLALEEAGKALEVDEVPVGCVVLNSSGSVIARGHNLTNQTCDPTQHAELVALATLVDKAICEAHTLVVTIEPCIMCAAALRMLPFGHRLQRVVFGARNERFGGLFVQVF
jgi:tRNA(Arg) A34 adenosine deaminase TadA